MRIPNLSTTENITETIRRMDQRRLELEQQVSSGQKITLPEDDGMRMGRLIKLDTEKSTLSQYRRNASYATEYLNAGHLNLDKLREVIVRAEEIARVAGSGLSAPASETYGFEVDQLIEEALNRVNSTHRNRSLFGGVETKPDFRASEVQLGKRNQKTLSFFDNYVGNSNPDGKRELAEGDEIWVNANGHEYVLKAKTSGFTTELAASALADAINNDIGDLYDVNDKLSKKASSEYEVFVRGSKETGLRNNNVKVTATTSGQGDLILVGGVEQDYDASAQYVTRFDLQFYFPDAMGQRLDAVVPGKTFEELTLDEKEEAARGVFEQNWASADFTDPNFPSSDDFLPIPSQYTLDVVASAQSFTRVATQADVDAGDAVSLGNTITVSGKYFNDLTPAEKAGLGSVVFEETWERDLSSSASYSRTFGSDYYFPKSTQLKLDAAASAHFNGKTYQELTPMEKEVIALEVFGGSWERDLSLATAKVVGASKATIHHPTDWKRLSAYQYGDLVNFDGKVWRSRIDANWNHKPGQADSDIWEEVPSQYKVDREDWELTVSGNRTRDYWLSPDGKMYDRKEDADERTRRIVIEQGYVNTPTELASEIDRLTKRVTYAIPQFSATGSESGDALVAFDPQTQEFHLASPTDGGSVITGTFLLGEFTRDASSSGGLPGKASLEHDDGDVIFRQGRYYLALQGISSTDDRSSWEHLSQWEWDENLNEYVPPNNLGEYNPANSLAIEKGQHVLAPARAATQDDVVAGKATTVGDQIPPQYYVATSDVTIPAPTAGETAYETFVATGKLKAVTSRSDGDGNVLLLGEALPIQGNEKTFSKERSLELSAGDYLYDPGDKNYYIATQNLSLDQEAAGEFDPSDTFDPVVSDSLKLVSASFGEQGADWSSAIEYQKGQIVNYNGRYYQCLQDNWKNLALDPATLNDFVVVPSDETIPVLVQGSGEIKKVANVAWAPVGKPLGHVLKFSVEEEDTATVNLLDAGPGGVTAKASVMVDAFGNAVGMRVLDPGRYYSGTSSDGEILPPSFDFAKVLFPDGQEREVKVFWYQDFSDPGAWKVSGFDFEDQTVPSGIRSGPQTGDTYSFATGTKTFLEHRDEDGSIVDLAYNGSTENSEFYVGNKSKISSFLEAKNKNTEELGDVVSSLIDLRESLRNAKPTAYAAEVEAANQQLIALEEKVVDKMGELSAKMVRMETVKSHDEDYYMELNERISRDLDVDLSEAIMRLMRASTAYQASMQVGAQLMNTSLLNYL